jgi:hypothetical protein
LMRLVRSTTSPRGKKFYIYSVQENTQNFNPEACSRRRGARTIWQGRGLKLRDF